MTGRLREIEQRCENLAEPWWNVRNQKLSFESVQAGIVLTLIKEDIPYLLGVIKEQQFKLKQMELNHNVEMMKLQRELNHAHFRELSSNGEHSEDAKPLDG